MRLKPGSYFALFLLVLSLAVMIISITFKYWESIFLPLMISSSIFILMSIQLVRELRAHDTAKDTTEEKSDDETRAQWHRFRGALAWMAGFSLAIYLVGFLICTPLFVLSYLKRQQTGWIPSIVIAIITVAVIYGIFNVVLRSPLFEGVLFGGR
jgi:hypothetical protein